MICVCIIFTGLQHSGQHWGDCQILEAFLFVQDQLQIIFDPRSVIEGLWFWSRVERISEDKMMMKRMDDGSFHGHIIDNGKGKDS